MRRILKIIFIILVLVLLILLGAWLVSRRQAKREGTPPPTFRQFLSLGDKAGPETPAPSDGLSSDFTEPDEAEAPGQETSGQQVTVSQFTSGPMSPAEQGSSRPPASLSDDDKPATKPPAAPPSQNPPSGSATSLAGCTNADVTILFTADEITRLNALQNRFYQVAQTLHTDEDIKAELQNYNEFKAENDKVSELYNYCNGIMNAPTHPLTALVSVPRVPWVITHIATPFWHVPTQDKNGYLYPNVEWSEVFNPTGELDMTRGRLEQYFKLNLW